MYFRRFDSLATIWNPERVFSTTCVSPSTSRKAVTEVRLIIRFRRLCHCASKESKLLMETLQFGLLLSSFLSNTEILTKLGISKEEDTLWLHHMIVVVITINPESVYIHLGSYERHHNYSHRSGGFSAPLNNNKVSSWALNYWVAQNLWTFLKICLQASWPWFQKVSGRAKNICQESLLPGPGSTRQLF